MTSLSGPGGPLTPPCCCFLNGASREIDREIFFDFCKLLDPPICLFSPSAGMFCGLAAEGISATAVACKYTDLLLILDWFVFLLMADCPAPLPCSLSLELTELVTLPGIFFRDITCLALLVVAVLPLLLTRPVPPLLTELYLPFSPTPSRFTLELL